MYAPRLWRLIPLLAVLAAAWLATPAPAQDKKAVPAVRADIDRQVNDSLREVINQGADLFNGGDHAACYFLYHGALITVGPLLEHRPELQKAIQDGLTSARRLPRFAQRAYALRGVLDQVRDAVGPVKPAAPKPVLDPPPPLKKDVSPPPAVDPPKKPMEDPKKPAGDSLWERLGGEANVTKVVDDFTAAVVGDPKVDFLRGDKFKDVNVDRLKKMLVEQISSVAGGPYRYSGLSMKETHAGMGISDAEFDAVAGHLKKALEKHGAKAADVDAVLAVVGKMRADMVEKKTEKKAEEKEKK